jgi:hypothetical protein
VLCTYDHARMAKRIVLAVLWGLATWTWVSMAHVFLGIPEFGMLAGAVTAAAITASGIHFRNNRFHAGHDSRRLAGQR